MPSSAPFAPYAPPALESAGVVALATVRAIATPRRLLPILVVAVPLLAEQAKSGDPRALTIGAALCAACVIVAPVTWRILAGARPTAPRVLLYAAIGAAIVFSLGAGVPGVVRVSPSFLTASYNLGITLALYLVGGWGLGRDVDLEARLTAQRARAAALEREAERAQLLALRAHLDPHFLFNTLNAIAEWCRLDGAVAEQAVLRLAEMLRAVLAGAQAEWWPLDRELALVDALFELHRMRDPERFSVARAVDDGALRLLVPPLFLLPIAENAVKHGPAAGHRGEIQLAILRTGGALRITLENPGPYHGPRHGSDGLPTASRRLALAYEGHAHLAITGEGERTRVEIALPERPS
jgi:two-component system, LytTR family, sensor histidine kinase AlgZ